MIASGVRPVCALGLTGRHTPGARAFVFLTGVYFEIIAEWARGQVEDKRPRRAHRQGHLHEC